jgi:hypothetical protein
MVLAETLHDNLLKALLKLAQKSYVCDTTPNGSLVLKP